MSERSGGRLAGKVAVITGGASGIGRRTAEVLADEGAKVVLGDRNADLLAEVRSSIGDASCAVRTIDVTNEDDVESLIAHAAQTFGGIDIAVNSAGIGTAGAVDQLAAEQWNEVISISLTGVFFSVKHEARQMRAQGRGGSIINISSLNGHQAGEGMAAYCAAKGGVDMLTRVAAIELGDAGIRVNAIAPGFVETPLTALIDHVPDVKASYVHSTPLGRPGRADDIARAALFLASEDSSWVAGEILNVDGGATHREYPRMFSFGL
ncbi:MAG TPA: SDR family NAD(P)-dependent oxidoreductase [Mycobacteriales bacterium]|nr:SDR family NAD(P)-dependent oxidoreductase [Mycobacteriales bacterium]